MQNLIPKILIWLVFLASCLLGIYARIVGLGQWPLAEDEYYFTTATLKSFEFGWPLFPCGGSYVRGLLLQYLSLIPLSMSNSIELSMRLIPSISSVLSIIPVYFIAKRFGGKTVAAMAIMFCMLSVWEIEFARFARMYSPFQLLFLVYFYFLIRLIDDKESKVKYYLYILSAVSIFVYEGAIFLIALNYLPFVMGALRIRWLDIVCLLVLPAIYLKYMLTDFRSSSVDNASEKEFVAQDVLVSQSQENIDSLVLNGARPQDSINLPIQIPSFLGDLLSSNLVYMVLLCVLIFAGIYLFIKLVKSTDNSFIIYALCGLSFLAALLHAIFLWCCLLAILILLYPSVYIGVRSSAKAIIKNTGLIVFQLVTFLILCVWVGLYISNFEGLSEFSNYFLKYPDFYYKVARLWYGAMPVESITIVFVVFAVCFLSLLQSNKIGRNICLLSALVIILFLLVSILETTYAQLKYSFFIYPLILILFSASLYSLATKLVSSTEIQAIIIIFFVSGSLLAFEDFNLKHITSVQSLETNFRNNYEKPKYMQYYPRKDYRTPAEYINENRKKGDTVISIYVPVVAHYLSQLDYMFWDHNDDEFVVLSSCGGEKEFWTDAKLISDKQLLYEYLEEAQNVWIINYSDKRRAKDKDIEQYIREKYKNYLMYSNLDNTINVYYIHASRLNK